MPRNIFLITVLERLAVIGPAAERGDPADPNEAVPRPPAFGS